MPRKPKAAADPAASPTTATPEARLAAAEASGLIAHTRVLYLNLTGADLLAGRLVSSPFNARGGDRHQADIDATGISIVQHGLLQAIQTRVPALPADAASFPPGQVFEVIWGETRHQGLLKALTTGIADERGHLWRLAPDVEIGIGVRVCSDDEAEILSAIENTRRAPMPDFREARIFGKARERLQGSFKARGFKRVEDAIAQDFGVSPRTVNRRLSLLKLAPELQQAFQQGEIDNAQALAFARGTHDDQRAHWKRCRNDDWYASPECISHAMMQAHIPYTHAFFDPALYTGETVEDDDGEPFFADAAEFARLQETAIAAELERLRQEWPWAEIIEQDALYERYEHHGGRKTDKEAGALIVVRGTRVEIVKPVLRKATVQQRARDKAAAERRQSGTAETASTRPPLIEAQIRAVHAAKTRALREAAIDHPSVLYAAACLGLLGCGEVRGLHGAVDWQARHGNDQYPSSPAQEAAVREVLDKVAARLPKKQQPAPGKRPSFVNTYTSDCIKNAAPDWLRALAAEPPLTLLCLLNHLLAERLGSWAGLNGQYNDHWFGDSRLAIAIAELTGAAAYLAAEWTPDRDYFNGYTKDRLQAIARDQLGVRKPPAKKGELVELCASQPPGTWRPELFPELRFQTGKDTLATLAAPLPKPADLPPTTPLPLAGEGGSGQRPETGEGPAAAQRKGIFLVLVDAAREVIRRFDAAVLAGDEPRWAQLAEEFADAVQAVGDAEQLREALRARPGAAPLWGQPGELQVDWPQPDGGVIPLRLITDGLFTDGGDWRAFTVRPVDPERPFLNEDGVMVFDFFDATPEAIDFATWALREIDADRLIGPGAETLPAPRPLVPLNDLAKARLADPVLTLDPAAIATLRGRRAAAERPR